MRSGDACAQGLSHLAAGRRRLLGAWGGTLLSFGVVALMGGCGSDGAGAIFVDPGRYSLYHCDDLAAQKKKLIDRENELRGLIEKANESVGGAVVGSLAYRSDYEAVLAEEKLLQRKAAEKNCSFASPTQFQSDQTIR
ncbi:MAG TPA: twin-arginine translocation pathway signal [Xanthobacteraceae bacterium]|nr:twin-arginine translocation pathway signal [Xanthobacteraceae bacterium]